MTVEVLIKSKIQYKCYTKNSKAVKLRYSKV